MRVSDYRSQNVGNAPFSQTRQPQDISPKQIIPAISHPTCYNNYNNDPGFNVYVQQNQSTSPHRSLSWNDLTILLLLLLIPLHIKHTYPNPDLTLQLLQVQAKITRALNSIPLQCSTEWYMNELKSCTSNNLEEFSSWLLSIKSI